MVTEQGNETTNSSGFQMKVAWIFMMEGGTKLWKTDSDDISLSSMDVQKSYLEENGFYGFVKGFAENTLYFEVDPLKTKLKDFYKWTDFLEKNQEVPDFCDIWRPFIWISSQSQSKESESHDNAVWGWKHESESEPFVNKFWDILHGI